MPKNIQLDPLTRIDHTEGCWYWTGPLSKDGYGLTRSTKHRGWMRAHRRIYELLVGPIPEGLTLDHECHNRDDTCPGGKDCFHRSCVRPDHLIPRLAGPNAVRGVRHYANATHCKHGHPFDEVNTYVDAEGRRWCRRCRVRRNREAKERRVRWESSA